MKFSDLNFEPHPNWDQFGYPNWDGVQARHFFDNGYGVSVIKSSHSYGGSDGLYEAAVLKVTDEDWEITYDTPITSDVLGHQTVEDIDSLLFEIEKL
jgi:hypothetical protein